VCGASANICGRFLEVLTYYDLRFFVMSNEVQFAVKNGMKDIVSVREGVFYPNTIRVKTIVGLIVGVYKLILLDSTQVQLSLYIVLHRL